MLYEEDNKTIEELIRMYNKSYYKSTGTITRILPNTLYFVKSTSYFYRYLVDRDLTNLTNIHVIVPREMIDHLNHKKLQDIKFYIVDDVKYVFGMVHNWIHEGNGFYLENNISKSAVIHHTVSLDTEGIHLFHTPSGIKRQFKHISNVVIKELATVGANSVIHKGVFEPTVIGMCVTIGSLVNIGHNCKVGNNTVIAPGTTIGGSCNIGNDCWIGMGSTIKHHTTICDKVIIGQHSNVIDDIHESGIYVGNPAIRIKPYTENWNF